jgi:hypothetical protein
MMKCFQELRPADPNLIDRLRDMLVGSRQAA